MAVAEKKLPDWAVFDLKAAVDLYLKLGQTKLDEGGESRTVALDGMKITQYVHDSTTIVHLRGLAGDYKDYCLASFKLVPMPGCCGVIVSTGASVSAAFWNLGVGQRLMELKFALAKRMGYTSMICTTIASVANEVHILEKTGWKRGEEFINARTGRTVVYYTRNIKDIVLP